MTAVDQAVAVMEQAKREILDLRAQVADLRECVTSALCEAETRLYLLPPVAMASDGEAVSAQKDILSAQISRYRAVLEVH